MHTFINSCNIAVLLASRELGSTPDVSFQGGLPQAPVVHKFGHIHEQLKYCCKTSWKRMWLGSRNAAMFNPEEGLFCQVMGLCPFCSFGSYGPQGTCWDVSFQGGLPQALVGHRFGYSCATEILL